MIIHSFVPFFLPKSLHFFINRNKQIPAFECAFIRVLFDIDNKNSFHGGRKIELSANPQNFAPSLTKSPDFKFSLDPVSNPFTGTFESLMKRIHFLAKFVEATSYSTFKMVNSMISLPGPLTSKHIQISLQNFHSPALFVTLWTSQCEVTISSFHL